MEANNELVQAAPRGGAGDGPHPGRAHRRGAGAARPRSTTLVEAIGELDWVLARAHAAERMEATAPAIDREGRVALRAARHPAAARAGLARSLPRRRAGRRRALARAPAADHHRPQRRRQDDRAQDAGAGRPDGPGRLPRARRRGLAPARVRVALRHHRRRAVGGGEPLHLLRVREADPRGAGRGGRIARSCSSTSWAPAPTPTRAPRWPRRSSRRWPSAARWCVATTHLEPLKRVRLQRAARPQRLGRVRHGHPGADVPAASTTSPGRATRWPSPAGSGSRRISSSAPRATAPPTPRASSHLIARLDEASRTRGRAARWRWSGGRARRRRGWPRRRRAEASATARARELVERAKAEAAALLTDVRRARGRRVGAPQARRALAPGAGREPPAPARGRHARRRPAPVEPGPDDAPLAPRHDGRRGAPGARAASSSSVAGDTAAVQAGRGHREGAARRAAPRGEGADAGARPRGARPPRRRHRRRRRVRATAQELMLIGRTTDEARDLVEKYLDDAFMAGPGERAADPRQGHRRAPQGGAQRARPITRSSSPSAMARPPRAATGATVAEIKVS